MCRCRGAEGLSGVGRDDLSRSRARVDPFDVFVFAKHIAAGHYIGCQTYEATSAMARKAVTGDQIVKLIVGAGQASPSPPVGPALGSKGVKSMDFCKVCLACHRPCICFSSTAGVQCSNSELRARHAHSSTSHCQTRSILSF